MILILCDFLCRVGPCAMSYYGGYFGGRPTGGTLSRASHRKRPREFEDPYGGNMSAKSARVAPRTRMAYRQRRRKTRRRRGGRRRYRRITPTWPRSKLVKFRVVSTFALTDANGQLVTRNIQASSLSDPHTTLGSNLPLGLDQWAAMYKKYCVVKSTHYVKAHDVTSTGAVVFGLTLRQPNESAALASAEAYLEAPNTRSKMLTPDVDHAGLGITYYAKRYWHTRTLLDHEDLHGAFSTSPSDPAKMAYVDLWTANVIGSDGTSTLEGHMTSEYTVLLFDPVTPARSSV